MGPSYVAIKTETVWWLWRRQVWTAAESADIVRAPGAVPQTAKLSRRHLVHAPQGGGPLSCSHDAHHEHSRRSAEPRELLAAPDGHDGAEHIGIPAAMSAPNPNVAAYSVLAAGAASECDSDAGKRHVARAQRSGRRLWVHRRRRTARCGPKRCVWHASRSARFHRRSTRQVSSSSGTGPSRRTRMPSSRTGCSSYGLRSAGTNPRGRAPTAR